MADKKSRRWHEMCIRGARVRDRETGEHIPVRLRSDALDFFREILHRHEPRQAVANPNDHAWLTWLLSGSPAAQLFHGPAPYAFVVHANAELGYAGKGQGFSCVRFDPARGLLGTTLDPFSITRVLANKIKEEEDVLVRAFRNAIEDQLLLFRDAKLAAGIVCPYTKVLLTAGEAYVVHTPPFKEWVQKFLTQTGVARTQLRFNADLLPAQLEDPDGKHGFVSQWREFHAKTAMQHIEVVSFQGFYAALRKQKDQERAEQDVRLMALRTGR